MSKLRYCPRGCGRSRRKVCPGCGETLVWEMTDRHMRFLRGLAFKRKGLDGELYKINLVAVGAERVMELTRKQYQELVKRLNALPDHNSSCASARVH